MSKRRLVITAVLNGESQSEVARTYGVSQGWISRLLARYRLEGEAAFLPRSRRPRSSPTATSAEAVELIVRLRKELTDAGLDAGPQTIAWHLEHHHQVHVSVATISRQLTRAGLVVPEPKKKPKTAYLRFAAEQPNETWQADFTHYRLTHPGGSPGAEVEVLTWLDDHSRFALSVTTHHRVTGPIVLATFRQTTAQHGVPASTLTDNGMVFTTRLSGGKGGRNGFEHELRALGVLQKNSRPGHPTTCGKVERFQQTMKNWLRAQPAQPASVAELQAPDRCVRHHLQPAPAAPLPAAPGHPGHRLRGPSQGRTRRPDRRHPRPGPHRPHRPQRKGHPPPRRPALLHRGGPNPRPNPRPPARPGPRHPHHRRRHRRAPPRAHTQPQTRLPTPRPTTRTTTQNQETGPQIGVRPVRDLLRDHIGGAEGIRTPDLLLAHRAQCATNAAAGIQDFRWS